MNMDQTPNGRKATVAERLIAVVPLAMVTVAYVVCDAVENLSPSEKDRDHHRNHKEKSVLPVVRELAALVFSGERPAELLGYQAEAQSLMNQTFSNGPARLQFAVGTMTPEDLPAVIEMLRDTKGVSLKSWETSELLKRAIERNPGLNLIARAPDGALLAASFAGETGLRGSFHHLTVREGFRQNGIASALVDQTLERFREIGILRIINIVENDNLGGIQFWLKKGFRISTAQGGITVQMTKDFEPQGKDA